MRILELSRSAAAAYAGLLLGEYGFAVDVVTDIADLSHEQTTNDLQDGFAGDSAVPELDELTEAQTNQRRAAETFLQRHKNQVDLAEIDLTQYDCVIEDVGNSALKTYGLSHARLLGAHAHMVLVSLSPFGLTGPYAQWHATELQIQAAGGVMHAAGYDDGCPRKLPGDAAAMIAGIHGATAATATVFGIDAGTVTRATHIDISAQDTFMQHWTRHVADYAYSGAALGRTPSAPKTLLDRHTAAARDGWIFILALRHPWQDVMAFLGLGEFLTPANMASDAEQPWADMEDAFFAQVASKDRYQWFAEAAELGWTFAPVDSPIEAMNSPQAQARAATETVRVATTGDANSDAHATRAQIPRAPVRWD